MRSWADRSFWGSESVAECMEFHRWNWCCSGQCSLESSCHGQQDIPRDTVFQASSGPNLLCLECAFNCAKELLNV